MKNIGIWGVVGVIVVIIIAIVSAGQMGETSKAHATGTVVLADGLSASTDSHGTLFLIVYDVNQPMPPYGALKKTLAPGQSLSGEVYEFFLTTERLQVMREGSPFPEQVRIKARLDQDGVAGPDQPGDLVGEVTGIARGSREIVITIDKQI